MKIAEIRGEKIGGGVGVPDHLCQTHYSEICILVFKNTKYISKLKKYKLRAMYLVTYFKCILIN